MPLIDTSFAKQTVLAFVACALGAAACSAGSEQADPSRLKTVPTRPAPAEDPLTPSEPEPVSVEDTSDPAEIPCGELYDALASYRARCLGRWSASALSRLGLREDYVAACRQAVKAPGSGRTVGTLVQCATGVAALTTCRTYTEQVPGCVNTGTLADGAACNAHDQCASGDCSGSNGACGACEHRADEGEACKSRNDCRVGLGCVDAKCVALPPKKVGEECLDHAQCPLDMACFSPSLGPKVCTPPKNAGELCDRDLCVAGLACSKAKCSPPLQADSPCVSSGECDIGLYCNVTTGRCAPVSSEVGPGSACGGEYGTCRDGLRCNFGDGGYSCVVARKAGEQCAAATDCALNLTCVAGSCSAPDATKCN